MKRRSPTLCEWPNLKPERLVAVSGRPVSLNDSIGLAIPASRGLKLGTIDVEISPCTIKCIQPWSPILPLAIAAMRTVSTRGSSRDNQVATRTLVRPG